MDHGYSVVTFAYNEEKKIRRTLQSIIENSDNRLSKVTVIANGCADKTAEVSKLFLGDTGVDYEVVSSDLGDKFNAWNVYVYSYLPKANVHFFVDSDVTFPDEAFSQLYDKLVNSTGMNAVTGIPQSGRHSNEYAELATKYSCLFGNLYGITNEFAQRLRAQDIRLPIGLLWNDAQITKLVNDNLEYSRNDDQKRVTFVKGVGYKFSSLKPWRLSDCKLYINRICRYRAGQLQEQYLDELPFIEWPVTMNDINGKILDRGLDFRSLGKLFLFRGKIRDRLEKKF